MQYSSFGTMLNNDHPPTCEFRMFTDRKQVINLWWPYLESKKRNPVVQSVIVDSLFCIFAPMWFIVLLHGYIDNE